MKSLKIKLLIWALFVSPAFTFAQIDTSFLPKEWKQLGLEDIDNSNLRASKHFVSASRSHKKIEDLPVTVTILSKEEIKRNGWVTLVDVLKHAPGIRVSQPGSGELGETFMMRGLLGNEYAKIMINNVPISPSVASGLPIGAQLPIRQAERIEIIYGPASSIFGADATCGVINIVTLDADFSNSNDANIVLGTNDYRSINFNASGKIGKNVNILKFRLYGSDFQFNDLNIKSNEDKVYQPMGYFIEKNAQFNFGKGLVSAADVTPSMFSSSGFSTMAWLPKNYVGTYDQPLMSKIGQSASLTGFEFQFRDFSYSFLRMSRKDFSSIGRTSYKYRYNDPDLYLGETISKYSLVYNHNFNKTNLSATLSYNKYRMDNNSSYGITYDAKYDRVFKFAASDDLTSEVIGVYSPNEHLEALAGITYQLSGGLPTTNDLYSRFNVDDYQRFSTNSLPLDPVFGDFGLNPIIIHNFSFFTQAHINLSSLNIVLGFREDIHSKYGVSLNPRLAMLYKIVDKISFRASYGEAFKAPSPSNMYRSSASLLSEKSNTIAYAFIPNTDLMPEKMKSYEVGIRFNNKKFALDFAAYYNVLSNLTVAINNDKALDPSIYPNSELPSSNTYQSPIIYKNMGIESTIYGLQITGSGQNIFEPLNLNASLSVNISKGIENFSSVDIDFRQLPRNFVQAQTSVRVLKELYVNLFYIYSSNWLKQYLNNAQDANLESNRIDAYQTLDASINYYFNKQISMSFHLLNAFNAKYGGISASNMDTDLHYNPQTLRNLRFEISYRFN